VALVLAAVAAGVALMASAFWHAGRLHVVIDPANDAVLVFRTLFGVRRGRESMFRRRDVADVKLERGPVMNALAAQSERPELGARLLFVQEDGRQTPLTERFLRGTDVHARGFAALRAALELPPVAAEATDVEVPAPVKQPAEWKRAGRWAPLVLGIVVLVVGGNALCAWHADRTHGRMDVRAQHRCKVGGMELLPGGSLEMVLEPGRYTVEVWSPSAPSGWETQEYEVRIGETTTVVCRPRGTSDAGAP